MAILCTLVGHTADAAHHCNQGLDFSRCHGCGCDLIRAAGSEDWVEVPKGFRVVWREFGRAEDAASVAQRMRRNSAPPRRRGPRCAPLAPPRDRRSAPIKGAASMFGVLAQLRSLLGAEDMPETDPEPGAGYVICLPASGAGDRRGNRS